MAEEIFFNDSSLSIVEEWMGSVQKGNELESEENVRVILGTINSKAGLGSKAVVDSSGHVDALAIRLAKNAKKQSSCQDF